MKTFKGRGNTGTSPRRSAGARPPFKRSFSAGAPARDKVLYAAVCNACGKSCQVPFEPNGRKPVYCRECFIPKEEKAERGERASSSAFAGKRSFGDRAPARTMYPRPEARAAAMDDSPLKLIAELNAKVDMLMKMVEKLSR